MFRRVFTTVSGLALSVALLSIGSGEKALADSDNSVGATLRVGENETYTSIQEAVDDAEDFDCVLITPDVYYEEVDLGDRRIFIESEDIDDDLTVATTVIDGGNTRATCIRMEGGILQDSWIRGITLRNATEHGMLCGTEADPSNAFIRRCRFIDNGSLTSGAEGGGLAYNRGRVLECSFRGNEAEDRGGGFFATGGDVEQCIFVGNESADNGGGLARAGRVERCEFYDNVADRGGGMANSPDCLVTNCVFAKNTSDSHGGAVYRCRRGRFYNCTFVLNHAGGRGGALREVENTGARLRNNIFFFNDTDSGKNPDTSDCIRRHSSWFEKDKEPTNGNNNIGGNSPLLNYVPLGASESGEDGNYHLTQDSACRGSGQDLDGSGIDDENRKDYEGDTRPLGGDGWDIGADEY